LSAEAKRFMASCALFAVAALVLVTLEADAYFGSGNVGVVGVTQTSIDLVWETGNWTAQGPVYFKICYKAGTATSSCCEQGQVVLTNSPSLGWSLNNLQPSTSYKIKVQLQKQVNQDKWLTLGTIYVSTLGPAGSSGGVYIYAHDVHMFGVHWPPATGGAYDHVRVCYKLRWTPIPLHELCTCGNGHPATWSPPWIPISAYGFKECSQAGASSLAIGPEDPVELPACRTYDVYVYAFQDDVNPGVLLGTTIVTTEPPTTPCWGYMSYVEKWCWYLSFDYESFFYWWLDVLGEEIGPIPPKLADAYMLAEPSRTNDPGDFDKVRETVAREHGVDLSKDAGLAFEFLLETRPDAIRLFNEQLPQDLQLENWLEANAPEVYEDILLMIEAGADAPDVYRRKSG